MAPVAQRVHALLAAGLALSLGLSVYLLLRPAAAGPALLLGSTPALTHAFAFSALLLVTAQPRRPRQRRLLLGGWLVLLVGFECMQLPAARAWVGASIQYLESGWPYLASLLRAHGAGTFDMYDVLASALGVTLAAALLRPVRAPTTRGLTLSRETYAASS
ncbi:MAG: hypothetical protein AAGA68_09630 [Pseudomonadota bacterium]